MRAAGSVLLRRADAVCVLAHGQRPPMEEWTVNRLESPSFAAPPVLVAAWPGMGQIGSMAVDYLHSAIRAQPFAELKSSSIVPEAVIVQEGITRLPEVPPSRFFYLSDPALIVFEAGIQLHGVAGKKMVEAVLELGAEYGVKRAYTLAAFAQTMSHNDPSEVFCAAGDPDLLRELRERGLSVVQDGFIGGLNGLFLVSAGLRGVQAACLMGTLPTYAANMNYPKAVVAVLRALQPILHVEFDMSAMERNAIIMDRMFGEAEERVRQLLSSTGEKDEEFSEIQEEKVPQYVLDKIEQLFNDVAKDRSRVRELKAELDRWKLFDLYENRFLDLFKRKGGAGGGQ